MGVSFKHLFNFFEKNTKNLINIEFDEIFTEIVCKILNFSMQRCNVTVRKVKIKLENKLGGKFE